MATLEIKRGLKTLKSMNQGRKEEKKMMKKMMKKKMMMWTMTMTMNHLC